MIAFTRSLRENLANFAAGLDVSRCLSVATHPNNADLGQIFVRLTEHLREEYPVYRNVHPELVDSDEATPEFVRAAIREGLTRTGVYLDGCRQALEDALFHVIWYG